MNFNNKHVFIALTLSFGINSICFGQNEVKIISNDNSAFDRFGNSVSINGDYAVVGAEYDGPETGSAYVFKRSGNTWTQQAKLTASDGTSDDYFGHSVAIEGDYIVVGAILENDTGSADTGSAYVFQRNGTTWTQQAKLIANDAADGDRFGESVSISGEYIIAGAYADDDAGSLTGSAYIFKRNGNVWSQQTKLLANDASDHDNFGEFVSISGDYAIIGAQYSDNDLGSAYIFKRNGNAWSQQAKLTANITSTYDYFGHSVSIDGDYVIIGSKGNDSGGITNNGSAYIFKRNGNTWNQQTKLIASDAAEDDYFGFSVSISENYAVIGAWGDNDGGSNSGSAYIFERVGNTWTQKNKLTANDAEADDKFGESAYIDGNYAIVGSRFNEDNGEASGSAYIYSGFVTVGINEIEPKVANGFELKQNYPNPFNPSTTISYEIPTSSFVSLEIYNLNGELVKTLVNEKRTKGNFSEFWDGKDENGNLVSSGTYLYKLEGQGFSESKKLTFLK